LAGRFLFEDIEEVYKASRGETGVERRLALCFDRIGQNAGVSLSFLPSNEVPRNEL